MVPIATAIESTEYLLMGHNRLSGFQWDANWLSSFQTHNTFIQSPAFYLFASNTFQSHHAGFYGFRARKQTKVHFRIFKKYILFEPKLGGFAVSCCETNYKESVCIQFCFFKHANSSLVIIMVQWIGAGARREFSYWFLRGRNFTAELALFWLGWKLCKTTTVIIIISAISAMFKPGLQVP